MSVSLKIIPNAFKTWLSYEHPNIPFDLVSFKEGHIDQTLMNPYTSQIIIVYKTIPDRYVLLGCILYGTDELVGLIVLKKFDKPMIHQDEIIFVDSSSDIVSLDLIKQHIDGIYFSLKTFQIIKTIAPYVPRFFNEFILRPIPSLVQHLREFSEFLELVEPELSDLQDLWKRTFRDEGFVSVPLLWFKVPIEQYPITYLRLKKGGYFYVPGTEMDGWIWKHLTSNCANRFKTWHNEQILHLLDYMTDYINRKKRREYINVGNPDDRLAPCMQKILSGHFPTDLERQYAVRVLSGAKIPLDYVKGKLEELNDR